MKNFSLSIAHCALSIDPEVGTWREYFFAALIIAICLFVRFGNVEELSKILSEVTT